MGAGYLILGILIVAGFAFFARVMTVDLLGLEREDMIERLEERAGVTSALPEAQDATTPFI